MVKKQGKIKSIEGELQPVLGVVKRSADKKAMQEYVETNQSLFESLSTAAALMITKMSHNEKLHKLINEFDSERGVNMCTAFREWEEDCPVKGRAESRRHQRWYGQRYLIASCSYACQQCL